MPVASDLNETLPRLTVELGAEMGVDRLSLRQIATAAGVSTTAIFQNFGGKAELFVAAVDHAVLQDEVFHHRFAEEVFPLVSGQGSLADALAACVLLRARRCEALFLSEILVNLHDYPECAGVLGRWHAARERQWAQVLERLGIDRRYAAMLASYLLMEGLYAHALGDSAAYRMLLAETCRAQCDKAMRELGADPQDARAGGGASLALGVQPFAVRDPSLAQAPLPMAEHLLACAVEMINEGGIRKLNQRALASRAGVSGSLIAYHFGDMKTLTIQAIWRALVQGIPSQLDPAGDQSSFPKSLREWFEALETMLGVSDDGERGFYISASLLSANACLLACHNPELMPLVTYLRGLEGWGTYRVSQAILATGGLVRRDHAAAFGVWIKSEALLRHLRIRREPAGPIRAADAAAMLFPPLRPEPQ